MKAVADTLGVARSNLVEQLQQPERPRRGPYRRAEDEAVLAEIRAITVLQQLPAWFEDYNTVHPHSGLRMRWPREFIALQSANQADCPV